MGILTKNEILREIETGNVKIEPFSKHDVGPASVDLHLGNTFRVFKKVHDIVRVTPDVEYGDVTDIITINDGKHLVLMPGETVLGMTREKVTLPPNISGWLEGRSRYSRLGLLVHISASFMQPGIANQQCLEISNFSSMPLAIYPGTPICQFIFQRTEGEAVYEGRFKNQGENNF